MNDDPLEQPLKNLRPRTAPPELRAVVLARLATAEPDLAEEAPARSSFDTWVNLAIAASVLVAAGLWYVNLYVQPQRLQAVLGPTPAERQVNKTMQMLALDADDPANAKIKALLRRQLQSTTRPTKVLPPHSAIHWERLSLFARNPEDVETNFKVHAPGSGDTSDRRRGVAVVVADTA